MILGRTMFMGAPEKKALKRNMAVLRVPVENTYIASMNMMRAAVRLLHVMSVSDFVEPKHG